jgi:hypothetical protein
MFIDRVLSDQQAICMAHTKQPSLHRHLEQQQQQQQRQLATEEEENRIDVWKRQWALGRC